VRGGTASAGVSVVSRAAALPGVVLVVDDRQARRVRVLAGAGSCDAARLHAAGDRAAVAAVLTVPGGRTGQADLARSGLLRPVRGRARAGGGLPAAGSDRCTVSRQVEYIATSPEFVTLLDMVAAPAWRARRAPRRWANLGQHRRTINAVHTETEHRPNVPILRGKLRSHAFSDDALLRWTDSLDSPARHGGRQE
jgi:hypothetical protein